MKEVTSNISNKKYNQYNTIPSTQYNTKDLVWSTKSVSADIQAHMPLLAIFFRTRLGLEITISPNVWKRILVYQTIALGGYGSSIILNQKAAGPSHCNHILVFAQRISLGDQGEQNINIKIERTLEAVGFSAMIVNSGSSSKGSEFNPYYRSYIPLYFFLFHILILDSCTSLITKKE